MADEIHTAGPATLYLSSKGPKPIADLPYAYLKNALAKLEREGFEPERAAEVDALRARKAVLDAEYEAAKAQEQPE